MKIAHFVSNFPQSNANEAYGKSLAAYNLCKELSKIGHQVHVLTISNEKKNTINGYDGIIVHRYKSQISYNSEGMSLDILFDSLKYDFDIVHIHSGISMTLIAGYFYSVLKRKPLIITWHGDSVRDPKSNRYVGFVPRIAAYFYRYWINLVLARANRIISVSKAYKSESQFLEKYSGKVIVIPNGVDIKSLENPFSKDECKNKLGLKGKKIILFLGSLYDIKGPQVLVKSIPDVIRNETDIQFVFVGGGDLAKYESIAEELSVKEYTKFVGYVTKDKSLYYKASDIFVLPSLSECFPLVLLEAMACELPIIASEVGGVSDLIKNGNTGVLIAPDQPRSLAISINSLINKENSKLIKKIIDNSIDVVKKYTWRDISIKTDTVYNKVCSNKIDKMCSNEN